MQTQETWTKEKPETPDSVLVQQALAGHQEAFEALVSRYEQSLLGLIYSYVGEYHEAQNVLQQVCLQLYLSLAMLRQNGHIKPWLFTVARNRSLDILRSTRVLSFSEVETGNEEDGAAFLDTIPDTSPTPEELAERHDLQQAVQRAILALPHSYRSVVLLSYSEQLTFTPDWTSPQHATFDSQNPIPSGQTIPTRSLSMREMKQCQQDDHYLYNRDQASLDGLT